MSVFREKLEYIITSSLPDNVKINNFDVDPDWSSNSYFVFINIDITDYISTIDELYRHVKEAMGSIDESLSKYVFDENGRYLGFEARVSSDIHTLNFKEDEYCLVQLGSFVFWG